MIRAVFLFLPLLIISSDSFTQEDWLEPHPVDSLETGSNAMVAADGNGDVSVAFLGRGATTHFISYSTDAGASFSIQFPSPVASMSRIVGPPEGIAFDSDRSLLVFWESEDTPLTEYLIFIKSTDRGISFFAHWTRVQYVAALGWERRMQVTSDNTIHVIRDSASHSYPQPDFTIYTRFIEGDAEEEVNHVFPLLGDFVTMRRPDLLVVGDTIHTILETHTGNEDDYRVQYSRSIDGGATFSPFQIVNDFLAIYPRLVLTPDGDVNIVYGSEAGPGQSLYLSMVEVDDTCVCFSPPTRISSYPLRITIWGMEVVSDTSGIYMVYDVADSISGLGAVFYAFERLDQPPVDSAFFPRMQRPRITADGLGGKYIVMENVDDHLIYFTRKDVVLDSDGYTTDIPTEYALGNNYPNPFNPSTTFSFSIPQSSIVNLAIFNLLGEQAATLVSGHKDAGTHIVQWDATGYPTGVYFYRLVAGSFVETKKLVIVR